MQLPDKEFLLKYHWQAFFSLLGFLLLGLGVFFFQNQESFKSSKVEVLSETNSSEEIVVEVAGAVINPGVYRVEKGARVEDILIKAGGFSAAANRDWIEKMVNRAALVKDGQKLYIPKEGDQSGVASAGIFQGESGGEGSVEGLININTASQKELESINGIAEKYAQNIIAHRPYSTLEELVSKGAIYKSVFEKIKNQITIY